MNKSLLFSEVGKGKLEQLRPFIAYLSWCVGSSGFCEQKKCTNMQEIKKTEKKDSIYSHL